MNRLFMLTFWPNLNMLDYSFYSFTLFYFLVSICFVFRTKEFVSSGLAVESLFSSFVGSENDDFILFQIRRLSLTILIHSLLPFGYVLGLVVALEEEIFTFVLATKLGFILFIISIILPSISIFMVWRWFENDYEKHPLVSKLKIFCDYNTSWKILASDINTEIKRIDKFNLHCSTLTRVIATDNWIIKLSMYNMYIAHQSDAALILCSADTHNVSSLGSGTVQYLNIEVKSTRNGAESFFIRCNALDYKDLEEKIRRPITILQDVTFHKSRLDMFLEAFRGLVQQNPLYVPPQVPEMCIGCMVTQSNVKLVKCCGDTITNDSSCYTCYCRPMWCVDCMGKWWASRQEQDHPESWLSSKCTCPVCRSRFCILDICPVQL